MPRICSRDRQLYCYGQQPLCLEIYYTTLPYTMFVLIYVWELVWQYAVMLLRALVGPRLRAFGLWSVIQHVIMTHEWDKTCMNRKNEVQQRSLSRTESHFILHWVIFSHLWCMGKQTKQNYHLNINMNRYSCSLFCMRVYLWLTDPSNAGFLCIQCPNIVITVPADVLAPNGARPSAGTVMTIKLWGFLHIFTSCQCFCVVSLDQLTSFKMFNKMPPNLVALKVLRTWKTACIQHRSHLETLEYSPSS